MRSKFRARSARRVVSIPIEERRRRPSPPLIAAGSDGIKVDIFGLAVVGLTPAVADVVEGGIPRLDAACVRSNRDLGKRAVGAGLSLMRSVVLILLVLVKAPDEDVAEGTVVLLRPPMLLGPRTPIPIVLPLFLPISIVYEMFPIFYLVLYKC